MNHKIKILKVSVSLVSNVCLIRLQPFFSIFCCSISAALIGQFLLRCSYIPIPSCFLNLKCQTIQPCPSPSLLATFPYPNFSCKIFRTSSLKQALLAASAMVLSDILLCTEYSFHNKLPVVPLAK